MECFRCILDSSCILSCNLFRQQWSHIVYQLVIVSSILSFLCLWTSLLLVSSFASKPHFSWEELDTTSEDLRERKMKNPEREREMREKRWRIQREREKRWRIQRERVEDENQREKEKIWGEIARRKLRIMCASRITTVVGRNELRSLVKNINKMCDPSSLLSALFEVTITKHPFLLLLSPMITKRWTRNHNKETGGRGSRERRKKEEREKERRKKKRRKKKREGDEISVYRKCVFWFILCSLSISFLFLTTPFRIVTFSLLSSKESVKVQQLDHMRFLTFSLLSSTESLKVQQLDHMRFLTFASTRLKHRRNTLELKVDHVHIIDGQQNRATT